jgi:signal transduction histidine kinase
VVPLLEPQALTKDVRLEYDPCPPDLLARADRTKAEQILLNLVSNALKFTPSGGSVRVSCRVEDERLDIIVRDTGVGIPEDKLSAIFEPFVQLGRSLSNMREGTGLGLSISRELARAMQGDVTVQSAVNAGSTFTMSLPRG